ncbi:MAG: hypothetical protein ACKO8G_07240 [Actinomycetota bacterium]
MSLRHRTLALVTAAAAFLGAAVVALPEAAAGGTGMQLIRYLRTVDLAEVQADAAEIAAAYEAASFAANQPSGARQVGGGQSTADAGAAYLESELRRGEVERTRPGGGLSGRSTSFAKGLPTAEPVGVDAGEVDSWQGISHFDSRFASAGRSYQNEPSDLALCASDEYILEGVNTAVQVYDAQTGAALLDGGYANPGRRGAAPHGLLPSLSADGQGYDGPAALALNEFFGESPAFDRQLYYDLLYGFADPADEDDPLAGVDGNSLGDPVCRYDAEADRWIMTTYLLYWDSKKQNYSGKTSVAVAVSETGDPTGTWNVFEIDATNNGEFGGPDHGCDGGFCFGDYPQFAIDENGVYITTVEFSLFGGDFNGSQLYAVNKADLYAADDADDPIRISYLDNLESEAFGGGVGSTYSVQPVDGTPGDHVPDTMYFGMSHVDVLASAGYSVESMSVYRLANTCKLNGTCDGEDEGAPSTLSADDLTETIVEVGTPYAGTYFGIQRPGSTPFLTAYNARVYGNYSQIRGPVPIDLGTDGKLYGAWIHDGSTLVFSTSSGAYGAGSASFNPQSGEWKPIGQQSGVAVFAVPLGEDGAVADEASDSALLAVPGQNFAYPTAIVNADGQGAIGTTLIGPNHWPSAAYLPFTLEDGVFGFGDDLLVALPGAGPSDGFSGVLPPGRRPRWGDYGGAATTGSTIWLSAGYIAQTCSFTEWFAGNFVGTNGNVVGTCGGTRASIANWSTGILRYEP